MTLTNRALDVIADELHTALKRETADILAIGNLLVEAKAKVEHGQWLPWLRQEFLMTDRSAQNYMKAAEFAAKNEIVADLRLSPSALYLLSGDSYWVDECDRREATDVIVKVASKERVGSDLAKEIIDKTRAKRKARDYAIAEAMADDKEQAKHDARENGDRWEDLEPDWTEKWIAGNWGDEREAGFEAGWEDTLARTNGPAEQDGAAGPQFQPSSKIETSAAVEQLPPRRSAVIRKGETRPHGTGAADRDACRVEGIDQLRDFIGKIMKIVSAPSYDDRDRRMIKHEHEPYMDGFIDEKGKCRFDQSQCEAVESPPATGCSRGNGVSPEESAEERMRTNEALDAKHGRAAA
jgi:hypothetical protein